MVPISWLCRNQYFAVACPPCFLKRRSCLVYGVLALKKCFQKCCTFQGMKPGENLVPVLKDMRRKKSVFSHLHFFCLPYFLMLIFPPGSLNSDCSILITRRKVDLKIRRRRWQLQSSTIVPQIPMNISYIEHTTPVTLLKFDACFKRYAPQKVGFFSPPFLLPPVFSYVDISSRQSE